MLETSFHSNMQTISIDLPLFNLENLTEIKNLFSRSVRAKIGGPVIQIQVQQKTVHHNNNIL